MSDSRPILGVTMGDPSGSGPEILVKALTTPEVRAASRPIAIGDGATIERAASIVGSTVQVRSIERVADATFQDGVLEVLDLHNVDLSQLQYGKVQAASGEAAFQSIVKGVELAKAGETAAIVTSAINKESLNLAGHHYDGHTEILADLCGIKSVCMLLVAGNFRVTHVSTHCSLRQAIERAKKPRIMDVIRMTHQATKMLGVAEPRIAVSGLNPHSGEGGLFGDEEIKEITPAIEAMKAEGFNVVGPIPPDTVFFRMHEGQYDAVVAMFHDQGHIPTKVIAFDEGVNVTLGLPIIRTSVDHGTVFGKAGKGTARPTSMLAALRLAAQMAKNR
ncbi:MAG TPA: 4-hydroxythreonine-4-phosphate dehydrogenase PdxA [Chloroflexota bacterium]|nr:4-hydroxythreonine-4-phosphate dehydrogenase PdxA [Chloroflexota bacterium]